MTRLPDYIISKIMLFVNHPVADILRLRIDIVSLGRLEPARRNLYLCREISNQTRQDRYETYVYGESWFYKYNFRFICGLIFEGKNCHRFHRDKIARLAHNEYVRNVQNVQNNDYDDFEYDEYIIFE